ncbi:p25-alpha-domain-containing protein [Cladochytrium replicatum]|nr:p25-alpha-domain-containing protein [Cladochytrium replicatum]
MANLEDLRSVYETFCNASGSSSRMNLASPHSSLSDLSGAGLTMDGARFAKFARDCKLIDGKRVTTTDVDIIFNKAKAKGSRRLDWTTFQAAVRALAQKKYPERAEMEAFNTVMLEVTQARGPLINKATTAKTDGVYDKLTNTQLYTGAHKLRFDEQGNGRGMEGLKERERSNAGGQKRGQTHIVTASSERLDLVAHAPKRSADSASKPTTAKTGAQKGGTNVYDRLTNTGAYTGTHKLRFDASGQGRGLAGRDSAPKGQSAGQYRGGDVKDLSQILRN